MAFRIFFILQDGQSSGFCSAKGNSPLFLYENILYTVHVHYIYTVYTALAHIVILRTLMAVII